MATQTVTGGVIWAEQDKDATKQYSFKLTDLLPVGVNLDSASATVVPDGQVTASALVAGQTVILTVAGGTPNTWASIRVRWVAGSLTDDFVFRVFCKPDAELDAGLGSQLFPNRFTAVAALRKDRLIGAAGVVDVSDDYVWSKILAAEAEVQHLLRVPLSPTRFFVSAPSQDQIDALGGQRYGVDPGYSYTSDFFYSERWGFIRLRNKPLVSINSILVRFPGASGPGSFFTIPPEWIKIDAKYADLQFIPTASNGSIPLNVFMMQALGLGRSVPFAIEIDYVAGLTDIPTKFPDLLDVAQKMAVLSILEDKFQPQSGSLSADGLSQSVSQDMDKHRELVHSRLFGPKGSNGGLHAAIHGIRVGAL